MNAYKMLQQLSLLLLPITPANAEISFDHSPAVPPVMQGQKLSGTMQIPASAGSQHGANLFHSFDIFNIRAGESATFTAQGATAVINNVIGRVTGGAASIINGQLNSTIADANLYLINPHGWLLGHRASLNVPAAFHLSTAANMTFADGKFRVDNTNFPTNVLSLAAPPQAFGFLNNSGSIEIKGAQLHVQTKQTFDVTAGDIAIDTAKITAKSGDIHLAAIRSNNATVAIESVAEGANGIIHINASTLDVSGNGGGKLNLQGGDITVSDKSILLADNTGEQNANFKQGIHVIAQNLTIEDSEVRVGANSSGNASIVSIKSDSLSVLNGGGISGGTHGSGDAGTIKINVGNILIDGQGNNSYTIIGSGTFKIANAGNGGTVSVKGDSLSVLNGGVISGSTHGSGDAGTIKINVGNILIDRQGNNELITAIGSSTNNQKIANAGNGGIVNIKTDSLCVLNGGLISSGTQSSGDAGNVKINASEILVDGQSSDGWFSEINSSTANAGNAGTVSIKGDSLRLLNSGAIGSNTWGSGNAGNVNIDVGNILIDSQGNPLFTGIGSDTNNEKLANAGNAGTVSIKGNSVSVLNGSQISSNTWGAGKAGDVEINAADILVDGQGDNAWIASTTNNKKLANAGNAGTVSIKGNNLSVLNGGQITSGATGTGDAGDVNIIVNDTLRIEGNSKNALVNPDEKGNSAITVESVHSNAGNIHINAKNLLYALNSEISTNAAGGKGNGGNIIIDQQPANFVVLNNSKIIANAKVHGDAGNISIFPDIFLQSTDSIVQASSPLGAQGTITITGANSNIAGSIAILSSAFRNTETVLQEDCRKRYKENKISMLTASSMQGIILAVPDDALNYVPALLKDCYALNLRRTRQTRQSTAH